MSGRDRPGEGPGGRDLHHGAAEREAGARDRQPAPAERGPDAPAPGREARAPEAESPVHGAESGAGAGEGRRFEAGGETWIARPAGESAIGHGAGARAYLVAVRFYRPEEPVPVSEALIPRGRFETLYDEELEELLRRATPLAEAPEPRDRGTPRAGEVDADDELPPEG